MIAVHMRRDDRALRGKDMIAWCKEHTARDSTGRLVPAGNWIDGVILFHLLESVFGAVTISYHYNIIITTYYH